MERQNGLEIAKLLEVSESTLRRWSNTFERYGHKFYKENTKRFFTNNDYLMFKSLKFMIDEQGLQTDEACKIILEKDNKEVAAAQESNVVILDKRLSVTDDNHLREIMFNGYNNLNNTVIEIRNSMKRFDQHIEREKKRGKRRDEQLTTVLKESMEQKKFRMDFEEKLKKITKHEAKNVKKIPFWKRWRQRIKGWFLD